MILHLPKTNYGYTFDLFSPCKASGCLLCHSVCLSPSIHSFYFHLSRVAASTRISCIGAALRRHPLAFLKLWSPWRRAASLPTGAVKAALAYSTWEGDFLALLRIRSAHSWPWHNVIYNGLRLRAVEMSHPSIGATTWLLIIRRARAALILASGLRGGINLDGTCLVTYSTDQVCAAYVKP